MRIAFCLLLLVLGRGALALSEAEVFGLYEHLHQESSNAVASLDADQRKVLFQWVAHHPVTSLAQLGKYDPQGIIGFCFGRSMAVHLMARKMQLNRASLRKLFVVGDLRSGTQPEWRFHVATLVQGDDRRWYAIDPVMVHPIGPGVAVEVNQWMDIVQTVWDKHKKARFYLTSVNSVLPDVRHDPMGTTNQNIIEGTFDPTSRPKEFVPMQVGDRTLHVLTKDAEERYMISTLSVPRFRFDGLRIDNLWIDYHNYFFDLIDDLFHAKPENQVLTRSAPPVLPSGVGLYGMKLHQVWRR